MPPSITTSSPGQARTVIGADAGAYTFSKANGSCQTPPRRHSVIPGLSCFTACASVRHGASAVPGPASSPFT